MEREVTALLEVLRTLQNRAVETFKILSTLINEDLLDPSFFVVECLLSEVRS